MPMSVALIIIVLLVLALAGLWASNIATRLHRLNIRTDMARANLEATLGRRAAVVATVVPDLVTQSKTVQSIPFSGTTARQRAIAEYQLGLAISELLQTKPDAQVTPNQLAELTDVQVRVELAIRFYNEAVLDTRNLRLRPMVRFFHLGGHSLPPEYFEAPGIETALPTKKEAQ